MEFKVGRPSNLTEEVIERVLDVLPNAFTKRQVARLAKVSHQRLSDWLNWGMEDLDEDINSIYAQFAARYEEKKGKIIQDALLSLKEQNSFQSVSWLLEQCFPEEFGRNSDLIKEIWNNLNQVAAKGASSGAKQMDSKGD